MTDEQIPTTSRRRILAATSLLLAGCTSRPDSSTSMDATNDSTADSDYDGVDRPEQSGPNQPADDVMDDDVYAIATADDPEAVATEKGSPTAEEGLLVVAHLTVEAATEADAPAEFVRVAVAVENRIEGVVPFDQLTELAAAETVERLATATVATQEVVDR